MSTHPNVILLLTLAPDGLARKTMRDILTESQHDEDDEEIKIGDEKYHYCVMESDYEDNWQIAAKEGSLIFFDLVTYGYGEQIAWDKLEAQKQELETWAKGICERHHCQYQISVSANYW